MSKRIIAKYLFVITASILITWKSYVVVIGQTPDKNFTVQIKTDDSKAAVAVVNQLFAEMAAANPEGILAVGRPDFQLVAIFKQKDGKSRIQVINGETFSKFFTDKTKILRETMYAPKVEINGDLAMVWGRYVFFDGEKLTHCGVDTFNLVRTENGWKLANGASTIEPAGCTSKEKAMKAAK